MWTIIRFVFQGFIEHWFLNQGPPPTWLHIPSLLWWEWLRPEICFCVLSSSDAYVTIPYTHLQEPLSYKKIFLNYNWCMSLCTCMECVFYASVCISLYGHIHPCVHVWKLDVDIECLPQLFSAIKHFQIRSFIEPGTHQFDQAG